MIRSAPLPRTARLVRASCLMLAAAVGLTGCQSSSGQPDEVRVVEGSEAPIPCAVGYAARPFGERFARFYYLMAGMDEALVEKLQHRAGRLDASLGRFNSHRAKEWERFSYYVSRAAPSLAETTEYRSGKLASWFGRRGKRLVDDTRCFIPRAWHALKLLE